MRRLFLCFLLYYNVFIIGANADLCLMDYSVLVVLDKDSSNKVTYGKPQIDDMNWQVDVNYDTLATMYGAQHNISGIASCSDFGDDVLVYDVNTSGVVLPGNKTGNNCWCSMLRPATTYPMFVYRYDNTDLCVVGCAQLCADSLIESYNFRDKFFEAIW